MRDQIPADVEPQIAEADMPHCGWAPSAASREEQLLARRALIGVLLERPQQRPDAPAALLPPGGPPRAAAVKRLAQSPEPIDYREHDAHSPIGGGGLGRYRGPRLRETRGAARPNNRQTRSGPAAGAVSKAMSDRTPGRAPRRPGTGGRRPKQTPSVRQAIARLVERLGEPAEVIEGPGEARTMVWHVNARPWAEEHPIEGRRGAIVARRQGRGGTGDGVDGAAEAGGPAPGSAAAQPEVRFEAQPQRDEPAQPAARPEAGELAEAEAPAEPEAAAGGAGMIIGRLSGREMQQGETVAGQILDGWEMAKRNRRPIADVVVCVNYRSELLAEERPDFRLALDALALGRIEWVGFRDPERVARSIEAAFAFYGRVARVGGEVWLSSFGRAIDWSNDSDSLMVALQQGMGQQDRVKLVRKLERAKRRIWLEEGRGWPGLIRFGFRRNRDRYLEVDPEQWWVVKFIHYRFGSAKHGRKSGCAALAAILAEEHGIDLSPERIRTMLQDPIYVDGTFTVNDHGQPVACEPIPLEDPIPLDVFQRNQETLACQKGPHKNTPIGAFCLNGIAVRHAACAGESHPKTGKAPIFKGRRWGSPSPAYYHINYVPRDCHGYVLGQRQLEAPVMRALIALAEDAKLQEAWAAAARVEPAEHKPILTGVQVAALKQEVANIEHGYQELSDELVGKIREGTMPGAAERAMLDQLAEQLAQAQRRLRFAQRQELAETRRRSPLLDRSRDELLRALKEICTEEVPEDPRMMLRRMAVVECCLSQIIVHDTETGEIELELHGPLAPVAAIASGEDLPVDPLDAAAHVLEAHLQAREHGDEGTETAAHPDIKARQAIRSRKHTPPGKSLLARNYARRLDWAEVLAARQREGYLADQWRRRWARWSVVGRPWAPVWVATGIAAGRPRGR
jgi:hypothetical protein